MQVYLNVFTQRVIARDVVFFEIIIAPSIRRLQAQPIKVSEFLDYVNTRQANISAYKSEFDVSQKSVTYYFEWKSSNV